MLFIKRRCLLTDRVGELPGLIVYVGNANPIPWLDELRTELPSRHQNVQNIDAILCGFCNGTRTANSRSIRLRTFHVHVADGDFQPIGRSAYCWLNDWAVRISADRPRRKACCDSYSRAGRGACRVLKYILFLSREWVQCRISLTLWPSHLSLGFHPPST